MATYRFQTDAVGGTVEAESLVEALEIVDSEENIRDFIGDGAWAWVEDEEGERKELGVVP